MREILSIIAVPLSGIITYVLGHMAGRKKTKAEIDKMELDTYKGIVQFYKDTYDDLEKEITKLRVEIQEVRTENLELKNYIHEMNRQLQNRNNESK